jgi:hypothetical protein
MGNPLENRIGLSLAKAYPEDVSLRKIRLNLSLTKGIVH